MDGYFGRRQKINERHGSNRRADVDIMDPDEIWLEPQSAFDKQRAVRSVLARALALEEPGHKTHFDH